jgi:uncharacterized protein involved in outer membrane biogenesis
VQTTLLGLAIALILALVTALVGPYFVNWNDHRAFFEDEASRLVGLNVQVAGPIKFSVLPTPAVTLTDIAIGPAGQTSRLRARSLSIELGLGPLMRGEIRATEARLVGPQFTLGLNSLGQVDWPAMTLQTETVAIERLNIEDGRVVLTDSLSNSRMVLDKLWFRGQVRSLTGPFRGEGAFVSSGEIHGYRVAAGRATDDGIKVKLNIDLAERPLAVELDGTLGTDRKAPRFDGNFTASRPVSAVKATGRAVVQEPWKLTSKVKADAQSALLEQIEFQYGPEQRAAKLDGAAEVKFGERPRLQAALSARQIDLDRLVATAEAPRRLPAAASQAVAELIGGMLRPSIPTSLTISVDAVTLGGAVLQAVGADLRADGQAWRIDKLDFRAPGFAKIGVTGRLDRASTGIGFAGSVNIDAGDPRALIAWVAGQPMAASQVQIKPWQFNGDMALSADAISIERFRSEFDRGVIEGRLAYAWPAADRPARLDADLKAGEIDFDVLLGFADGAFAGLGFEAPRDVALGLEIGRARVAGFEARNTTARLKLDAGGLLIERLSVADFGNATIEAKGRIETTPTPGGSIAVDLDARELTAVLALADRFAPVLADPLRRLSGGDNTAKVHATVSLENVAAATATAKLTASGRIGAVRLDIAAAASGKPEHFIVTDLAALAAADVRFEGRFESDDAAQLLAPIGLDRIASLDRTASGPARLSLTTHGPLNRELSLEGRLVAAAINAAGKGTLRLSGDAPATVELSEVSGTVAGRKAQGKLSLKFGDAPRVDGSIEVESAEAPALVAAAIGRRLTGAASEPFAVARSDLAGRIEFKTARATLSPTLEATSLRGVARFSPSEVVFDEVQGELAKGRLGGRLAFVTGADGVSLRGDFSLSGAEVAEFVPGSGARPPVTGRFTLRTDLEASGRSPAAFLGSLAGSGTIALENAEFSGLNPRVFDAVIRAVDLGVAIDADRLRDFVSTALETAKLPVARAEAAFTIAAGQARLSNIVTQSSGADLSAVASLDLGEANLDAVLTLSGAAQQPDGPRPTLVIGLKGPWTSPARTIDASALSAWLALRAVEQQAREVDAMERQQKAREQERLLREANVPPVQPPPENPAAPGETTSVVPNGTLAPPLPPAINVLPAPKPRAVAPAAPVARSTPKPTVAPKPAAAPPPVVNPPLDLLGAQR